MADPIQPLIAEAEQWLEMHRQAGRRIEAAACAIRLKALRDARAATRRAPTHD